MEDLDGLFKISGAKESHEKKKAEICAHTYRESFRHMRNMYKYGPHCLIYFYFNVIVNIDCKMRRLESSEIACDFCQSHPQ